MTKPSSGSPEREKLTRLTTIAGIVAAAAGVWLGTLYSSEDMTEQTSSGPGETERSRPAENGPSLLIIRQVNVIDVEAGSVVPNQTVTIRGDTIESIGPSGGAVPNAQATVLDAEGKFLIPGLWDMHVHTSTDSITREVLFPLFVGHGVLGVRAMGADCLTEEREHCDLSTVEEVNAWRADIDGGSLEGPDIVGSSHYVNGPAEGEESSLVSPGTPEHARAMVQALRDRGVDFIKVYEGLSPLVYHTIAEEAHRVGLPFAGHVSIAIRASEASDAGQVSIEHATGVFEECSSDEARLRELAGAATDFAGFWTQMLEMVATFDPTKCADLFERFRRNDTWQVPTLATYAWSEHLGREHVRWRDDPRMRFVPPKEREIWEEEEAEYFDGVGGYAAVQPHATKLFEVVSRMHRAGVPILAGSDSGTPGVFWGSALHEELELLVTTGLSNAEALRAATLSPAEFFGREDSMGSVQRGKRADLLLLDANPLEQISNTRRIHAVVRRGRVLDRGVLDGLIERAAEAAAAARNEAAAARNEAAP